MLMVARGRVVKVVVARRAGILAGAATLAAAGTGARETREGSGS